MTEIKTNGGMKSLCLFLLLYASQASAQPMAFAGLPDTVTVDSAILVIDNMIVGEYAYIIVTDSDGIKQKYVVLRKEIAATLSRVLSKVEIEQHQQSDPALWRRKFLEAPDTLRRKGK